MSSASLDAFFAHYFRTAPVNATFTGVHEYDSLLPDWSRAARERELVEMRKLHAALTHDYPLPASGLATLAIDPHLLDAELARANLDVRIAETESHHFHDRNTALWTGEAIFGAVSLMIRDFAPAAERLPALTARLAAVPAFLQSMRETINEPVPELWRARAERECGVAQELFDAGLTAWASESGIGELPRELGNAATAAREAFAEAASWLGASMRRDNAGDSVHEAGLSAGEPLLTTLLARGHFCDEPPRALLARAETDMSREQDALAQMLQERLLDWPGAQAAMAADRPTAAEYAGTFMRRWEEIRAGVQAYDAVSWPDWPIRYTPIPEWARRAAPQLYWLFYRSPAPFDRYDTYEYLVTPVDHTIAPDEQARRLAVWNHSTITLNHVVHHGGVGHHVQNWHATHRSTSRVGTIAAVDCASRIGMFMGGSMAEGWACYATGLTEELGLLTPVEVLSEQHTRVRLLARAMVDLRLHLGDWTFAECVAYYVREVGMSVEVATAETTKNSMFPATALMYWLGATEILDARARVRLRSGAGFSLRDFHDALLSRGAIPVLLATHLMEHADA